MATPRQSSINAADDLRFARSLQRARAGCGESLGDLLQGCRRYLLLTATQSLDSTLRPKEGASDLVQTTFVIAQRDFQSFEGYSIGELFAWLNRILERQLANQVRHFKQTSMRSVRREISLDRLLTTRNLDLAGDLPGPPDHVTLDDECRRVRLAVEQLSAEHQLVLRLRTWQRMPFADIGQQMHRSADAAEKLWLRAVRKLQAALKNVR